MWGGSGGTYLWVIVGSKTYEFLAHKWRVVDIDGQKVLLLAVHSSQCNDAIGPAIEHLFEETDSGQLAEKCLRRKMI
jgi:hypothetical protein